MLFLAKYIKEQIESEKYDGIIITHGTDTLQYTSAMLGYMFDDVSIPIVLVSSNYVLEDKRANGLINLSKADMETVYLFPIIIRAMYRVFTVEQE